MVLVGWHEFRSLSEGVSLLLVDVALAGHGGATSFGVSHTEEVVSSDSSGVPVVPGNRVVNLLSFHLGVNSIELFHGSRLGLSSSLSVRNVHLSFVEGL